MENDVLRNKIAPWQEKGRWYHGVIDSTGAFVQDKTDQLLIDYFYFDMAGATNILFGQLPTTYSAKKFDVIDFKIKHIGTIPTSQSALTLTQYWYSTGRITYTFARKFSSGYLEFWVFIVEI